MLEPNHATLSLASQCALLDLPRSTAYYRSHRDNTLDLELMRLMDQQYLKTPFYGVRRFTDWLCDQGHAVGCKRVRRLMRTLGIEAIYPKPRLSRPAPEHRIYPYLLRELAIERLATSRTRAMTSSSGSCEEVFTFGSSALSSTPRDM